MRLRDRYNRWCKGRHERRICREGGKRCKCCQQYIEEGRNPYTGLSIWQEPFDHEALADNWKKIDAHDGQSGRGWLLDETEDDEKKARAAQWARENHEDDIAKMLAQCENIRHIPGIGGPPDPWPGEDATAV